ncbi:50S ribosomal protein L11 methyltransferase [Luteolibacter sp. AS25]|uniref:50S ribosomal protein L11 methyltransferase n=1 Tax=Luteolibacter sp. AS25 TaxID=3135776 RepID=UPI00398B946A
MYLWSKLSGAQWIDAWEERFAGNPNFVMEYIKGGKSVRLQIYCDTKKAADEIFELFGGSVRKVKNAEWQKAPAIPKPLKVRDVFLVSAETEEKQLNALQKEFPKRELMIIPPEMAFGTGDHATTSTCLRFLVDISRTRKNEKWSVADLGSGTGLLAIAASKLGASEVWGCDFDPFAVEVAKRNAQRNGTPDITMKEQDVLKWKPRKSGYDVVLANLFSTVLLEAWPVIAKSLGKGGDLVVSGILASQAWEVFEGAAKEGIGFSKVVKKGKWVTAKGGWFSDIEGKSS